MQHSTTRVDTLTENYCISYTCNNCRRTGVRKTEKSYAFSKKGYAGIAHPKPLDWMWATNSQKSWKYWKYWRMIRLLHLVSFIFSNTSYKQWHSGDMPNSSKNQTTIYFEALRTRTTLVGCWVWLVLKDPYIHDLSPVTIILTSFDAPQWKFFNIYC